MLDSLRLNGGINRATELFSTSSSSFNLINKKDLNQCTIPKRYVRSFAQFYVAHGYFISTQSTCFPGFVLCLYSTHPRKCAQKWYRWLPFEFCISLQSTVFHAIDVDCRPSTDCTKPIYMSNKTLTASRCSVPHKPIHALLTDRAVAPFDTRPIRVRRIYRLLIPWYDMAVSCGHRRRRKIRFYDKSGRSTSRRHHPMAETVTLADSVCRRMSSAVTCIWHPNRLPTGCWLCRPCLDPTKCCRWCSSCSRQTYWPMPAFGRLLADVGWWQRTTMTTRTKMSRTKTRRTTTMAAGALEPWSSPPMSWTQPTVFDCLSRTICTKHGSTAVAPDSRRVACTRDTSVLHPSPKLLTIYSRNEGARNGSKLKLRSNSLCA